MSLYGYLEIEQPYPYLVVDARYEYVHENGHVESDGVLTVKGVNARGYREIIGVDLAPGEEESTWERYLPIC